MRKIVEKNYGADADGNRGISLVEYEIEDDDFDDINYQIIHNYDGEMYCDSFVVYLGEEDIEFTVSISEYITQEEFCKIASIYWAEDEEELEEALKGARSCTTCKWCKSGGEFKNDECWNTSLRGHLSLGTQVSDDFCCNRWEEKV